MNKNLAVSVVCGLSVSAQLGLAQIPLSSSDAVAFALSHRPELRGDEARITASERLRMQAGIIPNPRVLFRKEDLRPQTSALGANSQTYWEGEQLVEISGKRGGRIAVADETIAQRRLQRDLDRRQIALVVREAYWRAKALQALTRLYEQDFGYFQQVLNYHEARFKEGKLAEVDVLRVRLQGQQMKAATANARLDAEKALLQLAREMNAATNPNWVLSDDFQTLEQPRPTPNGPDLYVLRTEHQIAQEAISEAKARTKLEEANGRPDLLFTAGYKRDVQIDAPIAGVRLELPIFNRNQGAVAASRAVERAAQDDLDATRNRLAAELRLALREYEMRRDQLVDTFQPLREQAVQISDISRAAYQAGGLNLLRLLDAERARVEADLSYVRALEAFHISVVNLNYSEGMDQ